MADPENEPDAAEEVAADTPAENAPEADPADEGDEGEADTPAE